MDLTLQSWDKNKFPKLSKLATTLLENSTLKDLSPSKVCAICNGWHVEDSIGLMKVVLQIFLSLHVLVFWSLLQELHSEHSQFSVQKSSVVIHWLPWHTVAWGQPHCSQLKFNSPSSLQR